MISKALSRSLRLFCLSKATRFGLRGYAPRNCAGVRHIHATQRVLATPPPMVNISEISIERYHQLSDVTMDKLLESLENLLDDYGNTEYEVEYSSGVLTLNLSKNGTYVINKQPPNKQIWLSSPMSGPKRYDYVPSKDGWYYSRDGRSMTELLQDELSRAFGRKVDLELDEISKQAS